MWTETCSAFSISAQNHYNAASQFEAKRHQPTMNTETENNYLVITASGEDKIGIVDRLSGRIADSGCNIEESRMAVLGGHFAFIMLVSGAWHALSKLEGQMTALGEQLGLTIVHERTRKRERAEPAIPYNVEVVTMVHPGIVRSLAAFFSRNGINIEELQTSTYPAPHTGTPHVLRRHDGRSSGQGAHPHSARRFSRLLRRPQSGCDV